MLILLVEKWVAIDQVTTNITVGLIYSGVWSNGKLVMKEVL